MFPTYNRLACLVILEPTNGTDAVVTARAAADVATEAAAATESPVEEINADGIVAATEDVNRVGGILPEAWRALYWKGVMCSKPAGATSQYLLGFRRRG